MVYTENLFVKFADDASRMSCEEILQGLGLSVTRPLRYAANAFFVRGPALAAAGWTVIRVWEHEDPTRAATMVEEMVARGVSGAMTDGSRRPRSPRR